MAEDWISITEAAARLTGAGDRIDRSTLSRYLKQHAEVLPLRPAGKTNLVDFEALVAHRAENVRVPPQPPGGAARPAGRVEETRAERRFAGSQADAAARDRLAIAEMREMDLAVRKRELTPISEVDEGGRNAVVLMTASFDRAIEKRAADLSVRYGWDERQVRVALKAFVSDGVDVFHREVLELIDQITRSEGTIPSDGAGEGRALQ